MRGCASTIVACHLGGRPDDADIWLRAALREIEAADAADELVRSIGDLARSK